MTFDRIIAAREKPSGRISCAATGCSSVSVPPSVPFLDGRIQPPEGWGAIELHQHDERGVHVFTVFACSPTCERRIAADPPTLRPLGQPAPARLWTPR